MDVFLSFHLLVLESWDIVVVVRVSAARDINKWRCVFDNMRRFGSWLVCYLRRYYLFLSTCDLARLPVLTLHGDPRVPDSSRQGIVCVEYRVASPCEVKVISREQ